MASSVQLLFSLIFLSIALSATQTRMPYFPKSLILPVSKDQSTLQYLTRLDVGTPITTSIDLVVDLGGPFVWFDCASIVNASSSHNLIPSTSLKCSFAKVVNSSFYAAQDNKICSLCPENRVTGMTASGGLAEEILDMDFVQEPNIGTVRTKHPFLFSCAPNLLLNRLASGIKGVLGLGKTRIALPSQLSTSFGFNRKFSLCLSTSQGAVNIGDGINPFLSRFGVDLIYTPFVFNQDYMINMKSIKINGKKLPINASLLSVNEEGKGGMVISTIVPYTKMESTIYEAFVKAYVEVATSKNVTMVEAVAPFGVCFDSRGIERAQTGLAHAVPVIDLVLQSEMVKWSIHGKNSMVQVRDEVMCLGLLDGGSSQRASVVIGGYQLEDNLLEFNLATSILGFSSSLLTRGSSCSAIMSYPMSARLF